MRLTTFFWQYRHRYWLWAALALACVALYALTTAATLGLIYPIFNEVLQASDDEIPTEFRRLQETTEPAAALDEDANWLMRQWRGLRSVFEGLKAGIGGFYHDLKAWAGIAEGNPWWRSPVFFSPFLFMVVFIIRSLSAFGSSYAFQRIGLGITTEVRNDLYRSVIHQSTAFHQRHTSGELYSRVISDITKLQSIVSARLFDVLQQLAALIVLTATLLTIHFTLALTCLLGAPLVVVPLARFGKSMRKVSHRSQERMADLSALLTEGIRGNRVVKAFGMEDFECRRFNDATSQHLRVNLRAQLLSTLSSPVIESMAVLGGAALLTAAGLMIRDGVLEFEQFFQFLAVLFMMYDPIRRLNKVNLVLQEAIAASQRVVGIMSVPNEIEDAPSHPPLDSVEGRISFRSVSFAYDSKPVLVDFDLEIAAGEVVALVGASGAGKSTVVNLLPRFFDPVEGQVLIDGVDVRELSLSNLRSHIGIVTQETTLFNDTVRANIAYGHDEVPLERVRDAAVAAYADGFISELAEGYETRIGEGGDRLSGGQRQRLAIARALLKDAPILILDEATSHLDTESEVAVQRAIYNLMEGRTSLVIAHRISTVTRADRIVVMDQGEIIEMGTHAELLAAAGAYKRLYDLQFAETALAQTESPA